jgi:hypothetical protein
MKCIDMNSLLCISCREYIIKRTILGCIRKIFMSLICMFVDLKLTGMVSLFVIFQQDYST